MHSMVHFEIPFDDKERAMEFYRKLFGWKLEEMPGMEYVMVGVEEGAGGGMMKRQYPDHRIMDYFSVPSVLDAMAKVVELRGKVLMAKTAVPRMGYFAVFMDTEGNTFGVFEEDSLAK